MCYQQGANGGQKWTGDPRDTLNQLFSSGGFQKQSAGTGGTGSGSVTPPPTAPAGSAQPATREANAPAGSPSGSADTTGFNNLVLPRTGAAPVDRSVPTG